MPLLREIDQGNSTYNSPLKQLESYSNAKSTLIGKSRGRPMNTRVLNKGNVYASDNPFGVQWCACHGYSVKSPHRHYSGRRAATTHKTQNTGKCRQIRQHNATNFDGSVQPRSNRVQTTPIHLLTTTVQGATKLTLLNKQECYGKLVESKDYDIFPLTIGFGRE